MLKPRLLFFGLLLGWPLWWNLTPREEDYAPKHFPFKGKVNALIVFVQTQEDQFEHCAELTHYDENGVPKFKPVPYAPYCAERPQQQDAWERGSYQSWTDDLKTEWPLTLKTIDRRRKELPTWAKGHRFIDAPRQSTVTRGSLTDFYRTMSNGQFDFRGYVYPYVVVPEQTQTAYFNQPAPFPNGVVKMAHEVISYVRDHPENLALHDATLWDTYRNGFGNDRKPDGLFDMIILVYRFNAFKDVIQGSGISSFGTSGGENGFDVVPLKIGDLYVVEGYPQGSGVIARGTSQKEAMRVIVHELGHRYYGGHTNAAFDVMGYGTYAFYGAGNRLALGWAKEIRVNAQTIRKRYKGARRFTLGDLSAGQVLRVYEGRPSCGDLVIEARTWTNFWDQPANGFNDDGDGADTSLPQEGLYLHKTSGQNCGGDPYTSLEQTGLPDHHKSLFLNGIQSSLGRPAFTENEVYSPLTRMAFPFHQHPTLDQHLAITDIKKTGRGFSFTLRTDYLTQPASLEKPLGQTYAFDRETIARNEAQTWSLRGRFALNNGLTLSAQAKIWTDASTRLAIPKGQTVNIACANGQNVVFNSPSADATWARVKPALNGNCPK